MRRILLLMIVLCCTCAGIVRAQYDARLSQYFMAKPYYNPAVAGATEDLNILALARLEWVGMSGAPMSFFVTSDMPLNIGKTQHGIGLAVYTESIGLFMNTHVGAQYAYKYKLFGGVISGGLQIGLVNQSFDGSKVEMVESEFHQETDAAIPTEQVSGMGLDLNFGIYYNHKRFYAGFGMTHLTQPELQLDENAYTYIGRSFNLMGGYNIQLRNPLIELQPSVFLLTDMQSFHADITARLEYNKMFNGGISYRVNESVGVMFGVKIGRFQAGYAYDFPITALGRASSGSHELCLRYAMKLNKTKTGKNRHKSVRIL
ncbi:MAG TPA: type IX secretion system membrane protein PorP/SprF [Candidatus Parabacteroides intestinigallinarum]|uniref:Type IX secretion system membrane protein PorP/SprF n=1 Tax=Candidatus Parabacteroides intestinigallinarum TaxID=2838722 RepID=A0A9D2BPN6_9BACT|nr:type IX secretion system membrane protein PorP/SprF [Candidatus Parabacteroides intestinigallinarum]